MTDLLPANATPFENAESATSAARRLLPSDIIRTVWNPDTCPASVLPILANALSVDIWHNDWPVEKKRYVIRNALIWHRQKGTYSGIGAYVGLEDSELVRADQPGDAFFAGEDQTLSQRREWLNSFPEIRLVDYSDVGTDRAQAFCGPVSGVAIDCYLVEGETFFADDESSLAEVIGRRAILYRDGEQIPLRWSTATYGVGSGDSVYERIVLPGVADGGFFVDSVLNQEWLAEPKTAQRVLSFQLRPVAGDGTAYNLVRPSLTPIQLNAERVRARGVDDVGIYDEFLDERWLVESTAAFRIYDSLRLFDEERVAKLPKQADYCDDARFPLDPYTAELWVRVPGVRSMSAFDFAQDFLVEDQTPRIRETLDAIALSQSLRDTIYVNTRVSKPATFGSDVRFGEISFY